MTGRVDNRWPTPHDAVNEVVGRLIEQVRDILDDVFVGFYLYGSLAMDAFHAESDIDFVVVTAGPIDASVHRRLVQMHQRFFDRDRHWTTELEGSYLSRQALRRHDPLDHIHPHIDRGDPTLALEPHDADWIFQRYVLRAHGIVVHGPPIASLIDPIDAQALRSAARQLLTSWWVPMLENPTPLAHDGYRTYAIHTMCRMLYTLEEGDVVSKPAAAHWARARIDARWVPLIDGALAWNGGAQPASVAETQALIAFVEDASASGEMLT